MASIVDDRGYNQGFAPSRSTTVRMERRTDLLMEGMTLTPETRILEIGCGTGEVSRWMAERSPASVLGTDLCVPFIEQAQKEHRLPNLRYEVLDFNAPDALPDGQFDYIVGNGILHHLYYRLDEALATMRRLLKDGGSIAFLEPNIRNPYVYLIFSYPALRKIARLEPDEMAFTKKDIRGKLFKAGFAGIQIDYRDFLLPGIPDAFIAPSIAVGAVAEKTPGIKSLAQSIMITATKPNA